MEHFCRLIGGDDVDVGFIYRLLGDRDENDAKHDPLDKYFSFHSVSSSLMIWIKSDGAHAEFESNRTLVL